MQGMNSLAHGSMTEKTHTHPKRESHLLTKQFEASDSLFSTEEQACQADLSPFLQGTATFLHLLINTRCAVLRPEAPFLASSMSAVSWVLTTPAVCC